MSTSSRCDLGRFTIKIMKCNKIASKVRMHTTSHMHKAVLISVNYNYCTTIRDAFVEGPSTFHLDNARAAVLGKQRM